MTFGGGTSTSASAAASSSVGAFASGATSGAVAAGADGAGVGAGIGGLGIAGSILAGTGGSSFGRSFEIGGSTVLFVFTLPSFDSLCAFALSISETEGPAFAGASFAEGSSVTSRSVFTGAAAGVRAVFFCGSAFLGAGFAFETAGLRATAGLIPAGFRVAVLLVVLVGIIKDLFHGSCILSRASFLRFFFLRFLFSRNGIVNFLRFRFVHAKNIYKILHIGIAQSFEIRESGFYEGNRLLLSNWQGGGERLCRLRHFLLDRSRGRSVLVDVDFPTSKPRR